MWSYSSYAKLHQKYNVPTVFFTEIKGLCTALADNAWFTSNPEKHFDRLRLDAISIPDCVIKKCATHGARHGKTEVQREYHLAWNAWKRCCKKVDSQGEHVTSIHDRFLRDPVCREPQQLAIRWSEQKCKAWDELAKEYHTYKRTPEERRKYKKQWYLTLNKAERKGPMQLRSDYRAAVMMKNRPHHEPGEPIETPIHPSQQRRIQRRQEHFSEITCPALELINIQDGNIGLQLQVPRGGTHPNGVGSELT